jgi:hypothetical protein
MKANLHAPLSIIIFLLLSSCQKEVSLEMPELEPTETKYLTLGSWDESGRPNYLVDRDAISSDLLSFIDKTLPQNKDLRTTNPGLLNNPSISSIVITKKSEVFITFVSGVTVLTNSFAFYTYPTNKPPSNIKDIRTITYVFPSAGQGTSLQAGDKVKIGRFDAGTSIGFVLLPNAWNTATKTVDNKAVHFFTTDGLNPEADPVLKKHAVFINYATENKILICFENVDRTKPECNHDFNDLVFYATVIS